MHAGRPFPVFAAAVAAAWLQFTTRHRKLPVDAMPQLTIQQMFDLAVQHHQVGRLNEAAQLYRQVLAEQPNHAEALRLLGMIAQRTGRPADAVDLLRQAIAANPASAEAHNNLGKVLKDKGELDGAIAAYRQAISLKPNFPQAYNGLGVALQARGQLDAAIAAWRQAIALNPDLPGAYNNLGAALNEKGQPDQAMIACRRAIAANPNYFQAHNNLGNALREKGQLDQAIAAFRQAIALKANYPAAYSNLGTTLQAKGQLDEAIAAFGQAIALAPDAETYRYLANALEAKGRRAEALEAYHEALRLDPEDPAVGFEMAALTGSGDIRTAPTAFVRPLFDHYAAKFDEHLVKQLVYHIPEKIFQAVRAVDPRADWQVLDLGCGTGLCGALFRPYAQRLVGVDLSPRMLERAAARNVYDELIEADITVAMRARPEQWSLLLAGDMFIYVGDLSAVFPAASAALRPGGLFAFSVEKHDGEGFFLHPKRRFAHSLSYLRELARGCSLAEVAVQATEIRQEAATAVAGWVMVLRKSG